MFDGNIFLTIDGQSFQDPSLTKGDNWRFFDTRRRLLKLARALGYAEQDGSKWIPTVDLEELVRGEDLVNVEVGFRTYHKTDSWIDKLSGEKKSKTRVLVGDYSAAI